MFVTLILGALALLSFGLLLWQCRAGRRFPLHKRHAKISFVPAITLLKPLKGIDEHTAKCLRSWVTQEYAGPTQILFGVADANDPVCPIVQELLKEFPGADASLVITGEPIGANAKVSNLAQLAGHVRHELICISDADVRVPGDFLEQAVLPLRDAGVGLVNCFYSLANPSTIAMQWEAVAVNADFWSQVLQSNTLKPQDFALGAVMITRRSNLAAVGGFESLLDYLADDYQLGHRIAQSGARIELSPVVVECWDKAASFPAVWNHQVRWARTIRASQPAPYFFSILSNVTFWALAFALFGDLGRFPPDSAVYDDFAPGRLHLMESSVRSIAAWIALALIAGRAAAATLLHVRLTRSRDCIFYWWLVLIKDLLQVAVWAYSFLGNHVEWRGRKFRIIRGGKLVGHE